MDKKAIHAVEPYVNAGYDMDAEAILLCESDGTPEEVAEEIGRMTAVLEKSGASAYSRFAHRSRATEVLGRTQGGVPGGWSADPRLSVHGRHHSEQAVGRDAPGDHRLSGKYDLRCANVFHAGDGNLHPLIMYDANQPGQLERAMAFGAEILELSVRFGGTITGEHGVGIEKVNLMAEQFGMAEIETFHRLKAAFDEHGLLNPGKGVPTLARCREYTQARVARAPTAPRF
jgi:glycolate oxidase